MIAPPPPPPPLRQNSIPPVAPTLTRGGSVNGEIFRQGSPQSSSTSGNKISIPKAVIDLVVDQEKEREKEDKEALVVRLPSKMLRKYLLIDPVELFASFRDVLWLLILVNDDLGGRSGTKTQEERVYESTEQ